MKKFVEKLKSREFIIRTSVFLGVCLVLLFSLLFSNFFERLLNNTWFFYQESYTSSPLKIHYIDVGQGDCSLIEVSGTKIMIDCGPEDSTKGTIRFLNNMGINKNDTIDYLILTHTDMDHVGGACKLMEEFRFKNIYIPKVYSNYEVNLGLDVENYNVEYSNMWNEISKSIYAEVEKSGIFYNFDGVKIEGENFTLEYFFPLDDNYDNSNDYSPIIMFSCGGKKAMFVGDASFVSEYAFLNYYSDLADNGYFDCDVLKVGHHGSKTSTTTAFLEAVKPEVAIISVGEDNSYGHPTSEVLTRLDEANCEVLRTDEVDNIVLFENDGQLKLEDNLKFVGTVYFKWWYFVVSFLGLAFMGCVFFKRKKTGNYSNF